MEGYENIRLPWPDWKIVKYLGGGAYGKVYEIERNIAGIQEKAALKIISRPKDSEEMEAYYDNGYDRESIGSFYESEIQHCVREYQFMKELQGQTNIVSCDDFTVIPNSYGIGGEIFIRMELLNSLPQVLRERAITVNEIIKLGKDISRALILCESKHIIHRDIKPSNIMVSQFGDYKLGDFGVSKTMDHRTFATAMGTPEYQAPEVVHMERYGCTADIYSLGITMYWMLNNWRMPFIDAEELLTPMVKSAAMEKRYRGDRLPEPKYGSAELKKIVLKACEYRPENRYASAKDLYDALDALETGIASKNNLGQENGTKPARDIFSATTVADHSAKASYAATIGNPGGNIHNKQEKVDNFTSKAIGKQDVVQKKKETSGRSSASNSASPTASSKTGTGTKKKSKVKSAIIAFAVFIVCYGASKYGAGTMKSSTSTAETTETETADQSYFDTIDYTGWTVSDAEADIAAAGWHYACEDRYSWSVKKDLVCDFYITEASQDIRLVRSIGPKPEDLEPTGAEVSVSETDIVLNKGESIDLTVTASGDLPDGYTFLISDVSETRPEDSQLDWGDWIDSNSRIITYTAGNSSGSGYIRFDIVKDTEAGTREFYAYTDIFIEVK